MPFFSNTACGRRGAWCEVLTTTIGQRALILQCLDRLIEKWKCIRTFRSDENWG